MGVVDDVDDIDLDSMHYWRADGTNWIEASNENR